MEATKTQEKRCPKCDCTKPLAAFYRDKTRKDGVQRVCKPCTNRAAKEWARANPDKAAASIRKYRHTKPEALAATHRRHRLANLGKFAAREQSRRAGKRHAVPRWVDQGAIATVYSKAQELSAILGIELNVDHVVPLQSKLVCGLHVHDNLQLLASEINQSKGNHHWPDMPGEV